MYPYGTVFIWTGGTTILCTALSDNVTLNAFLLISYVRVSDLLLQVDEFSEWWDENPQGE